MVQGCGYNTSNTLKLLQSFVKPFNRYNKTGIAVIAKINATSLPWLTKFGSHFDAWLKLQTCYSTCFIPSNW